MNRVFKIILVCSVCLKLGCTSSGSREQFTRHVENSDCDQALLALPENQSTYKITSVTKEAGGKLISYSMTGAAYAMEVTWNVAVGVTSVVVMCAPILAVAVAAKGDVHGGKLEPFCFKGDIDPMMAPNFGSNTYKNTEKLRCPDVAGLSKSIRSVAQCYSKRGGAENYQKAVTTLEAVSKSGDFYHCLPTEELSAFTKDLYQYKDQLEKEKPMI